MDGSEHTDVTTLELLSERELEHEHWQTQEEEGQEVWHEEKTATVLVAEVWESPEVTESDSGTDSGENKGHWAGPAITITILLFFVAIRRYDLIFISITHLIDLMIINFRLDTPYIPPNLVMTSFKKYVDFYF